MFLLLPWLLHRGVNFWPALLAGIFLTIASFAPAALLLKKFGVALMP